MCFIVIIAQFYKYESILTVPDHFYISNQFILTYLYFRIFLYGHMHYDREIAKRNHCAPPPPWHSIERSDTPVCHQLPQRLKMLQDPWRTFANVNANMYFSHNFNKQQRKIQKMDRVKNLDIFRKYIYIYIYLTITAPNIRSRI